MRLRKGTPGRLHRGVLLLALLVSALAWGGTASATSRDNDAVYVLTNAVAGNAVAVFERRSDGKLREAGTVATGGLGTGAGLGSQGALVLSERHHWLFAVNPGSNDISSFEARGTDLRLVSRVASGGQHPISLTVHDDLLYVLNDGGSGNISGFSISNRGKLKPLDGSTRSLSNGGSGAAPGPAQIQFSNDGDSLVVTEKGTNLIDTFAVDDDGIAAEVVTHPSAGMTPFGFAFGKRGDLIISEAFGGAPGASALSSYDLDDDTADDDQPIGADDADSCVLGSGDQERPLCLHHEHWQRQRQRLPRCARRQPDAAGSQRGNHRHHADRCGSEPEQQVSVCAERRLAQPKRLPRAGRWRPDLAWHVWHTAHRRGWGGGQLALPAKASAIGCRCR